MNIRFAVLAGAGLGALLTAEAHAQTTPAALPAEPKVTTENQTAPQLADADIVPAGDIVVTGTRIRGIAPVGAAVIQLDQAAIRATGITSTTDLLKTVPQISNIGSDVGRTGSGAGGQTFNIAQSSSINLRGLGTQATLTLINGHRPAPGGVFANLFDPSAIPTIAIGNLEVLADGSSALYGSDAIAGVVNLGLRSNFTGLQAEALYTTADPYDAQRYSAIAGHKWSTGSAMIAGEFYRSSILTAADRAELFIGAGLPIIQVPNAAAVPVGYSNTTPLPNFTLNGTPYAENPNGTVTAGVKNVSSRFAGSNYLPATKRYSIVATAEQEINDTFSVYGQGHFSSREYSQLTNRGSGGGGGASSTALRVGAGNPYLVSFLAANGLAGVPGPLSYAFLNSVGPSYQSGYNTNWLGLGGVKIKLPHDFEADVNVSHGENREHRLSLGQINNNALTTALNSTNAATAFNPFGVTPASVINSISAYNNQTTGYDLTIAAIKVDGGLFHLPAGQVKIAVGAEYAFNREFIYNVANTNAVPDTSGPPIIQDTGRKMDVASVYGEVVVPLFGPDNARPLLRRLDVSGAVRYDHYNVQDCRVTAAGPILQGSPCTAPQRNFGTTNPKFGITWKPFDDLTLRGSYGTSFRYNLLVADPNGAPLYTANATYSDAVLGQTIAVLRGGGFPGVKPETAKTYTLGGEYKPKWVKGVDLTATYFNIRYNNIIGNPDAIFGGNNAAQSATYAPYIVRRPSKITPGADDTLFNALVATVTSSGFYGSGAVAANTPAGIGSVNVYVEQRNQNIGTLNTDGFDFSASYNFDIGRTNWLLGLTGTKYLNYKRSVAPGLPLLESSGLIDFPPNYRLRGQIGFNAGPIRTNFFVNYLPSYVNTYDPLGAIAVLGGGTGTLISSQTTADATFVFDFGKVSNGVALRGLTAGVDIINLFGNRPAYARVGAPIVQLFDSSTASALYQQVSFRLTKKF